MTNLGGLGWGMGIERHATFEEDFQNFLAYTGYGRFCQPSEISRLRIAYLHGNSRGLREASIDTDDDLVPQRPSDGSPPLS